MPTRRWVKLHQQVIKEGWYMARSGGFEPPTSASAGQRSIH